MIFFFASAGASSAYLTVSEIFPMETRAMAISFFYAVGTAIGGITGPLLFGKLIESGGETNVMYGYLLGAGADDRGRHRRDLPRRRGRAEAARGHREAAHGRGRRGGGGPRRRRRHDDDLDVDKLKGEEAAPVEGGDDDGKRFERERRHDDQDPGGAA